MERGGKPKQPYESVYLEQQSRLAKQAEALVERSRDIQELLRSLQTQLAGFLNHHRDLKETMKQSIENISNFHQQLAKFGVLKDGWSVEDLNAEEVFLEHVREELAETHAAIHRIQEDIDVYQERQTDTQAMHHRITLEIEEIGKTEQKMRNLLRSLPRNKEDMH